MPVTMTFNPDRIFLFTGGTQLGPFDIETAESLWRQVGCPEETWMWSPGMKDWTPMGEVLDSALPSQKGTDRIKVLAVDDDPVMLQMIKYVLEEEGYQVSTARDVVPACRMLDELPLDHFALVVTDYQMPGGSGLDLVRWIKQRNESLQVVLLTAQDDKELVKSGLRAGIFDFLEKPLDPERFTQSVKKAVETTHKRQEERQALMEMVKMRLSGQGLLAEEVIEKIVARESSSSSLLLKLDTIIQYSRKLEASSATSSGMKGDLGELNLLDVIQLLTQSGKTGRLEVIPHPNELLNKPCEVYFKQGKFYHVVSGTQSGIEALRSLLMCRRGAFEFKHNTTCDTESISGDPIALMLMISAEIDETQNNSA